MLCIVFILTTIYTDTIEYVTDITYIPSIEYSYILFPYAYQNINLFNLSPNPQSSHIGINGIYPIPIFDINENKYFLFKFNLNCHDVRFFIKGDNISLYLKDSLSINRYYRIGLYNQWKKYALFTSIYGDYQNIGGNLSFTNKYLSLSYTYPDTFVGETDIPIKNTLLRFALNYNPDTTKLVGLVSFNKYMLYFVSFGISTKNNNISPLIQFDFISLPLSSNLKLKFEYYNNIQWEISSHGNLWDIYVRNYTVFLNIKTKYLLLSFNNETTNKAYILAKIPVIYPASLGIGTYIDNDRHIIGGIYMFSTIGGIDYNYDTNTYYLFIDSFIPIR